MAPTPQYVSGQLRQLIYYHLDCNLLDNAVFAAGRLHAYEPRACESSYLLALCQIRLGQFYAAYESSRHFGARGTHLGSAYVFAQACLALERYSEGVSALEKCKSLWSIRNSWNKSSDVRRQYLPDAAAVNCLMGKLFRGYGDTTRAIECYSEAARENPFMWDAFQALCDLGAQLKVPNIYRMTPEMLRRIATGGNDETPLGALEEATPHASFSHQHAHPSTSNDPFTSTNRANVEPRHNGKAALFEKSNPSTNLFTPTGPMEILQDELETPTALAGGTKLKEIGTSIREDKVLAEPPLAPARRTKPAGLPPDWTADGPAPRVKTSTMRSKAKVHEESADGDPAQLVAPSLFGTGITERKRTVSGHVAASSASSSAATTMANDLMAPQRRSARILNSIRPQPKSHAPSMAYLRDVREVKKAKPMSTKARSTHATVGRVVSGNRKHGDPMEVDGKESRPTHATTMTVPPPAHKPAMTTTEKAKEQESLQWLIDLFMKLGSGHYALSRYRCQEAYQIFSSVPTGQRDTPWVQAQLGRALYEQAQYGDAEKHFVKIRGMAHSRLEDMEIYSTVLWHQKSEIDLSFLAHEVISTDRQSPQAWCVVGNSFSLQRDHDNALRCFQRATQLAPRLAYAHTLAGHEHAANEEHEQALAAYRRGMAADPRHYNAWYGLGRVYERQGQYALAEQHYAQAARINPTNAVLLCCVGGVLEKMRRMPPALDAYERAIHLAPRSSLARYKKARVLVATGRPDLALGELRELKDLAPDEANVHFLLGRVYKALKDHGNAIRHFTTALNLDPKVRHAHPGLTGSIVCIADSTRPGIPPHQGSHGGDRRPPRRGRHVELIALVIPCIACAQRLAYLGPVFWKEGWPAMNAWHWQGTKRQVGHVAGRFWTGWTGTDIWNQASIY